MRLLRILPAAALPVALLLAACGSDQGATTLEDLPATGSGAPSEQSADPAAVTDDASGTDDADGTDAVTAAISAETGFEDPVCGMTVAADAPVRYTHDAVTYGFCSPGCRAAFAEDPDAFLIAMEE